MNHDKGIWKVWIDTGGTFTDAIGVDPRGSLRYAKVLSSSSLRGTIAERISDSSFRVQQQWQAPDGFVDGFRFHLLGAGSPSALRVERFDGRTSVITLSEPLETPPLKGTAFEVLTDEEAPLLAVRLLTSTPGGRPLPPLHLRLATTRGTNALLEHTGAPTVLLVTRGFRDLLRIGDQQRPDLFALKIQRPDPLYEAVFEIQERIDASGSILDALDTAVLSEELGAYLDRGEVSFAVCLMNSYQNGLHERDLAEWLSEHGARYVSISSALSPSIKMIPRGQTTVVNAYLEPVLREYLKSVRGAVREGTLHVMSSAGGLTDLNRFCPKDSLLSGPAGGVVGAATIGRNVGTGKVISFDMGGTSTDVARYDEGYDYVFEHTVSDARLAAPALSIETVAAGGGSVCSFDGQKLKVGPESAGADPGPACYGAGGPLTLTDVNLLLGRLDLENFSIPIDIDQAEGRLLEITQALQKRGSPADRAGILEGFLQIANERMAETVAKISVRKGYDPAAYSLVAFGGAGAQHACALASHLHMERILIPMEAGLLSAYGLGHAVIEQFAEQQILKTADEVEEQISSVVTALETEAMKKLDSIEGVPDQREIRRRLVFMRLKGQDSSLEIEYGHKQDIREAFEVAYRQRYGHWIRNRIIEIESVRVVAGTKPPWGSEGKRIIHGKRPKSLKSKEVWFNGRKTETPVFRREDLEAGHCVEGPALILDPFSTLVIEPGWRSSVLSNGTLELLAGPGSGMTAKQEHSEAIALELFTNRFTSIADEMGEMLRRTALSVNVKERLDFSCALLSPDGDLVVNAPHIPVHLGALGLCVRRLKQTLEMRPGDVVLTNHPAYGGSHLPDVTVVTPVFSAGGTLLGFAANRAHHAEIGGTRPGSMPPGATTLAEEGVVIKPAYLVREGDEQWNAIEQTLTGGKYPTRCIEENMADLRAAVAANHRGAASLRALAETYGEETVLRYMRRIREQAAEKLRQMLRHIPDGTYSSVEFLDDGSRLQVTMEVQEDRIAFDFEGTRRKHPGNLNAVPAIVSSVIMYVLRLLIQEPLPLNEGLLEPVTIRLPQCMLNPRFPEDPAACPAVVGGNVETSQRLVDLLLKPFERIACSQGTMNNVLFGDDRFGYYETVGGGTGAGPDFDGADAVHHHMTNTAGTDPEILEKRYPVRLERYAIREGSGGAGYHCGGEGIEREIVFLQPVSLSVVTQHRKVQPYGICGGKPGAVGLQYVLRKNGSKEDLAAVDGAEVEPGDRFILNTPGGGGYGEE